MPFQETILQTCSVADDTFTKKLMQPIPLLILMVCRILVLLMIIMIHYRVLQIIGYRGFVIAHRRGYKNAFKVCYMCLMLISIS